MTTIRLMSGTGRRINLLGLKVWGPNGFHIENHKSNVTATLFCIWGKLSVSWGIETLRIFNMVRLKISFTLYPKRYRENLKKISSPPSIRFLIRYRNGDMCLKSPLFQKWRLNSAGETRSQKKSKNK